MPIDYIVSEDGKFVYTKPSGVLNTEDTLQYFTEFSVDKRIKNGCIEIVCFSRVTDFQLTYTESEAITLSYHGMKREQRICATVFVCESDLAYGIGRMLQTLHEIANPEHTVIVVRSKERLDQEIEKIRFNRQAAMASRE